MRSAAAAGLMQSLVGGTGAAYQLSMHKSRAGADARRYTGSQRCCSHRQSRHRVRRRTGISPRAASEFLTLHHAQAAADVSVALRDQLAALPLPLQQIVQLTHADAQKHLAHSSSTAAALAEQLQQVCNHLSCHQPQLLADLADATSSAAAAPQAVATSAGQSAQKAQDWLTPIADGLDYILQSIKSGLDKFDVPYSYGWSIIGLTIFTKVLTFPFTKAQVESAMSVQNLKPTIDEIKRLYGEDKDKVQRETSELYKTSGVNPLAGCLPTIATIPIFWGLFRTLSNVTNEGRLTEGFYWLPSLAGPASLADRSSGTGTAWLYPFVNGEPPLGWDVAGRYLVLPVLLVVLQYISTALISPPPDPNQEESQKRTAQVLTVFLPLMVGWFSISLPSGLGLYYFANIVITSGLQIWLRKLGGAQGLTWQQEIGVGQARRTGLAADLSSPFVASCMKTIAEASAESSSSSAEPVPEAPIPSIAENAADATQPEAGVQEVRRSKRSRAKPAESAGSPAEPPAAAGELLQPSTS